MFEHKIAFVDIIERAVRAKGSSKDDDIFTYSLDFDAFKICDKNQIFICTSKNAKAGLLQIAQKVDGINQENIFVCYQDRFHFNFDEWRKILTFSS